MDNFEISDLYYFYQLNQVLIDDALRRAKMNVHSDAEVYKYHQRLNIYNNYRDKIIEQIEKKLDEKFA